MTSQEQAVTDVQRSMSLTEGPLQEALHDITRALEGIEEARAAVTDRREDFTEVLRLHLQACATAGDDVQEQARLVVQELYWAHDQVRVSDLTTATGLSSTQLRRVVGPLRTEAPCRRCAAPVEVLQTSRSQTPSGLCGDCREFEAMAWGESTQPDVFDRTWDGSPATATSVSAADLARLADHLERVLSSQECDHTLLHTRRWARREGLRTADVELVVQGRGGFCDCEVLWNMSKDR